MNADRNLNLAALLRRYQTTATFREQQRVFNNYDLITLFNEGPANSRTRMHAVVAYKENFADKIVNLNLTVEQGGIARPDIAETPNYITVFGQDVCRDYLNLFSVSIRKISIVYSNDVDQFNEYQEIHRYISKNCTNSVESIEFVCIGPMPFTLQGFHGTFTNVKTIRMENVNFNDRLQELAQRFPNTLSLELYDGSLVDSTARFNRLQQLKITYATEHTCYKLNEIRNLLRSNVRLKIFHILMPDAEDMNMDFLLDIIGRQFFLTKLVVKTKIVDEPVTEPQLHQFKRFIMMRFLDLGCFRMPRELANDLWNELKGLRTFIIRIVKDPEIEQPRLSIRLIRTRTTRNRTYYEIAEPAEIFRRTRGDDTLSFRRPDS